MRNRPGSCAAPSSATEHSCQPAAPRLPAFLGDQAAPHSVRADAEECRSESKIFTAIINIVVGVAVISLLSGVGRVAIRPRRPAHHPGPAGHLALTVGCAQ